MPDKRQVRWRIKQLQRVQTWQLLVVLVLAAFVAATFLRLNNIGMVERRDAVLAADTSGDVTAITDRLYDLQRYSATHMNASTGPFYLEKQYKREVEKRVTSASQAMTQYGNVNAAVDKICRSRFTSYSQAWVQCFVDELNKYPASPDPASKVAMPSADLYRYNFLSPRWTPDFAGWAVVFAAVVGLLILVRLLSLMVLRIILKTRYRGV